jgi:gliding motility-associated-like protein
LAEGYYIITIRDAIDSVAVEFANPTRSPSIGITWSLVEPSNENCDGGRITTIISGGVAPFTYWWSDIQDYGESVRHHMVPGTYTLLVEDETGCRQNAVITMNCLFRIALPSTYVSPNDDGHNDFLYIENIHYYPNNRVLILNSLGELVKTLRNYDNETVKWDGRNERGQVLPDGVYYYILEPEGMAPIAGWLLMRASKFGK